MDVQFAKIEGRSAGFWVTVSLLAAFGVAGFVATMVMHYNGLYLSGMSNRVPWGLQIAMAIFYIGLSAGSLVVSGLYGVFGKMEYKPFARIAAYLAMLIELTFSVLLALGLAGRLAEEAEWKREEQQLAPASHPGEGLAGERLTETQQREIAHHGGTHDLHLGDRLAGQPGVQHPADDLEVRKLRHRSAPRSPCVFVPSVPAGAGGCAGRPG